MTVVVVLSNCPPKLRGDMTKWFIEINTGVYVGNISARVRDEVWNRIKGSIGKGHATLVFSTSGEQHMDFWVHHAYWQPVDYEGIKLMLRPENLCYNKTDTASQKYLSHAAQRMMAAKKKAARNQTAKNPLEGLIETIYVVLDLETTGLDEKQDSIIEIGAVLVEKGVIVERMQCLVHAMQTIPEEVQKLTGITQEEVENSGLSLEEALQKTKEFVEDFPLISHNAAFEEKFLLAACNQTGIEPFENKMVDTLKMAKWMLPTLNSYQLANVADFLEISYATQHRALADCEITQAVFSPHTRG